MSSSTSDPEGWAHQASETNRRAQLIPALRECEELKSRRTCSPSRGHRLLGGGPRYFRSALSGVATSKQHRGLLPRSQRSPTGTPASSAIRVSAKRQTSG